MSDSPDPFAVAFGRRLRARREAAGFSLADLAQRSSMQRAYIWRVEDGRTLPSIKSAARLAKALDLTLSGMLEGLENEIEA
ncbi:helix-turn-helix transcriptional regulator [Citromicrobium bathyomarinum]|uniref:helix-turn-helix domain-containing protein n=1 Tax=Citromicrobium bathyomarinum TaxID=72174 RepID=UPI00315A697F